MPGEGGQAAFRAEREARGRKLREGDGEAHKGRGLGTRRHGGALLQEWGEPEKGTEHREHMADDAGKTRWEQGRGPDRRPGRSRSRPRREA